MFSRQFLVACLAAGAALQAADQPLVIDPGHSRIEVAVKASLHSFTGQLDRYEAFVALDDQGNVKQARVRFDFHAFTTGKPDRDKAMHAWEQTDTFPLGEFVLTALRPAPGGQGFEATGNFTFHNVTRSVTFPITISHDGTLYAIDGQVSLDTRDYGLPVIRMMAVLRVDPVVVVRFHLQGRRSSGT